MDLPVLSLRDLKASSSTCNGSATSGTVLDWLRPDPLGLLERLGKEVVESLVNEVREDDRGLKPGL